jgi:hypothetical protein
MIPIRIGHRPLYFLTEFIILPEFITAASNWRDMAGSRGQDLVSFYFLAPFVKMDYG